MELVGATDAGMEEDGSHSRTGASLSANHEHVVLPQIWKLTILPSFQSPTWTAARLRAVQAHVDMTTTDSDASVIAVDLVSRGAFVSFLYRA